MRGQTSRSVVPVVGLFLLGLAPLLVPGVSVGLGRAEGAEHRPGWPLVLVVALQALPLLWVQAAPARTALVSAVALTIGVVTGQPQTAADLALPVAVYFAVRHGSFRAGSLAVLAVGLPVLGEVMTRPTAGAQVSTSLIVTAAAVPTLIAIATRRWGTPTTGAGPDQADQTPRLELAAPTAGPQQLIQAMSAGPEGSPPALALSTLSPRERQVLGSLAHGRSNTEIAADLNISVETVKTHVSRIIRKLPVRDRTSAAVFGQRSGGQSFSHSDGQSHARSGGQSHVRGDRQSLPRGDRQ